MQDQFHWLRFNYTDLGKYDSGLTP